MSVTSRPKNAMSRCVSIKKLRQRSNNRCRQAIVFALSGLFACCANTSASANCQSKDAKLDRAAVNALIALEQSVAFRKEHKAVCVAINTLIAAELKLLKFRRAHQVMCVIDVAYIETSQSNLKRASNYVQSLGFGCVNERR